MICKGPLFRGPLIISSVRTPTQRARGSMEIAKVISITIVPVMTMIIIMIIIAVIIITSTILILMITTLLLLIMIIIMII